MQELKNEILSKLDFLPDIISRKDAADEIVVLNAIHRSKNYIYQLSITLEVSKEIRDEVIFVSSFKIQAIDLFRDNGEDPPFKFTKKEIYNYIDYN